MLDKVLRDVAARGRTVVMTSHDLARVEDLASRFDMLSRGVIAASASRQSLGKNNVLAFYRQALQEK
jgi:heme exporter protein A